MGRTKGLLLDRDGVINVDKGFLHKPDDVVFIDGLFPFLRQAVGSGYRLAIVTNQSGVARGIYDETLFRDLCRWFQACFTAEGLPEIPVFACFALKGGDVASYAHDSFWRKPGPGMILEAALRLDLDLSRSALVGDKRTDMQAGLAAGIGQGLWLTGEACSSCDLPQTVSRVSSLTQAGLALKRFESGLASGIAPL